MKTQVIQLDLNDDVTAVRDKMSWAKSTRILLVYPRRSRILSRTLDLRLIQRHAAAMGVQLAVVAPRNEIRANALQLGIPVFKTPGLAQRKAWPGTPQPEGFMRRAARADLRQVRREMFPPEPHWRTLRGVRLAFFTLAVLAVLGLLVLFLPSASIQLTPKTQTQNLTISVNASPGITSVSLAGSIPARLTFTTLEGSKTAPATGTSTVPDAPAVGMVRFRNKTTGMVGIPSGTVVRTTGDPSVRFATLSDAVVAAGVDKTMDVPIQAVQAGSSGNLPADTLVAIEGDLGASLAVTNPGPTAGGSNKKAPVQTAGDRAALHAALQAEILAKCGTTLQNTLAVGDVFFPDTLKVSQVISETYFPAVNQAGDTLTLTMNLQCQAHYASAGDIRTLAELALDANLPWGSEPASDGVTIPKTGLPQTDENGITRWEVQAERLLRARLDPLAAVQLVQGRSPAQAARRLSSSLALGARPKILVKPAWWPWMPVIPFRIAVSISG